jgi:FkbM family methyltransferase
VGFAACREDEWIMSHFPREFTGYMADIGAWDGMEGSNSLSMEHAGWKCLCVEANPEMEQGLAIWRECFRICAVADYEGQADFHIHTPGPAGLSALNPVKNHPIWYPAKDAKWKTVRVPVRTLDSLLEEVNFPYLDALSIDVEGGEMGVLNGFTIKRWNPSVVVIENWYEEEGGIRPYFKRAGYDLAMRTDVNDCFVRHE